MTGSMVVPVLVPDDYCIQELDVKLASKTADLLRMIGFTQNTITIRMAKNILIKRFEMKYGRSNLTIWRLCQLSTDDLRKLVAVPSYRANEISPFCTMVTGTVH